MFKKFIVPFALLMALLNPCLSADADQVLISEDFVKYFKRLSAETNFPITLTIDICDEFNDSQRVKNEKVILAKDFPEKITGSSLMELFPELGKLLAILVGNQDPSNFAVKASIFVSAPEHGEKVEGSRSLQALRTH